MNIAEIKKYAKEISIDEGTNIEEVLVLLRKYKNKNKNILIKFKGAKLYSLIGDELSWIEEIECNNRIINSYLKEENITDQKDD